MILFLRFAQQKYYNTEHGKLIDHNSQEHLLKETMTDKIAARTRRRNH